MNIEQALGLGAKPQDPEAERQRLQLYINLKLFSTGQPSARHAGDHEFMSIAQDLLKSYREKNRLLTQHTGLPPRETGKNRPGVKVPRKSD